MAAVTEGEGSASPADAGDHLESLVEESVRAYYDGRPADGRLACDRLLNLAADPGDRKSHV